MTQWNERAPHPAKEYTALELWLIGAAMVILPCATLWALVLTLGGGL